MLFYVVYDKDYRARMTSTCGRYAVIQDLVNISSYIYAA
jgi:hypothetical protein